MKHAWSVGLALSLQTGLVSPVFHAKYDDRFHSVVDSYGKYVTKSQWQVKCGFTKGDPRMAWIETITQDIITPTTTHQPTTTVDRDQPTSIITPTVSDDPVLDDIPTVPSEYTNTTPVDTPPTTTRTETAEQPPTETVTRSGRTSRKPAYLDEYITYEANVANTCQSTTIKACTDHQDPVSFILTGNQDNYYYYEILREPDKPAFIKDMQEEIANHNDNGNWISVL
jgi:hypothetical protein